MKKLKDLLEDTQKKPLKESVIGDMFKSLLAILLGGLAVSSYEKNKAKEEVMSNKGLMDSLKNYSDAHKKAYNSIIDLQNDYQKKHPGEKLFSDQTIEIFKNPPTLDI